MRFVTGAAGGLVGVSRQAVSKWERSGLYRIPINWQLCRGFGDDGRRTVGRSGQEARREEYQGAEKTAPGWLAIHWHWLGVPVAFGELRS